MSIVHQCDVCGDIEGKPSSHGLGDCELTYKVLRNWWGRGEEIEFCSVCKIEFFDFIKRKKEQIG